MFKRPFIYITELHKTKVSFLSQNLSKSQMQNEHQFLINKIWYEMIRQLYLLYLCIYSSHVITPLVNSSMYSYVMHRQVKGMVTLNLFIESH